MNRLWKLAALTVALAGLTAGPGCGVFDDYADDGNPAQSTYYPRNEGPPPMQPRTSQAQVPAAPAGPGIYNETDKK